MLLASFNARSVSSLPNILWGIDHAITLSTSSPYFFANLITTAAPHDDPAKTIFLLGYFFFNHEVPL
jgi:hypothetical protein